MNVDQEYQNAASGQIAMRPVDGGDMAALLLTLRNKLAKIRAASADGGYGLGEDDAARIHRLATEGLDAMLLRLLDADEVIDEPSLGDDDDEEFDS